ncbi:hypothetical protein [Virgibacillus sp. DJP39]|uniref:hypothetical protein n=1 Tax=Virgibacillus sp. DJP39 TaxID=3409790 RepID=UPI003BB5C8AB
MMKLISLHFISPVELDTVFTSFLVENNIILVIAIQTLALSLVLRSVKVFTIELGLLILYFFIQTPVTNPVYILLVLVQILLVVFTFYRFKKAIDTVYQRQLEKTHQMPRKITSNGYNGSRSSFL